jgi:hypothetical protein
MVHTPGGIRCAECAQLRRPPMYEVSIEEYAKATAAAIVVALPLGFVGALTLPVQRGSGLFTLAIGLLLGIGAGAIISQAILCASGGKRGVTIQMLAVVSILIAGSVRLVMLSDISLFNRDTAGILAIVAGISYAWNQLR